MNDKIKLFEEFAKIHPIEWRKRVSVSGVVRYEYCAAIINCDDCIYSENLNCKFTVINEREYKKIKTLFPEHFL